MRIFQKEKSQENLRYQKNKTYRIMTKFVKEWLVSLKGRISVLKKVIEKQETIGKILLVMMWCNLKRLRK